ncbi:hypothetical protein [Vibrio sp. AND4]|uniref:hypothetical protein n=1 Tax=Vibrio sp. AND4 TaxID=314289 RepID=UPI00015F30F2|nr:hypothetical protein [Vibrio sp. AND4]EDP60389.1 hypothetical protein AND4_05714 [Vibrio sp. AND4]
MIKIQVFTRAIVAITCMSILGCGGGDGGNTNPPNASPSLELKALDGFYLLNPNETNASIDIARFVFGSNIELIDVQSSSSDCGYDINPDNNVSFFANSKPGMYCSYQYEVRDNRDNQASGKINTLSSIMKDPLLTPVSATMSVQEEIKVFDLSKLILDIPKGYVLNQDTIQVLGQHGETELGMVSVTGENQITYTSPQHAGWYRIVLGFQNPEDVQQSVLGVIFVTVSDYSNQSPTISNLKYTYTDNKVIVNKTLEVDLSKLTGLVIEDLDGDDWQLVHAQSMTATVTLKNPDLTSNKAMNFTPSQIGPSIVSYIITDHKGGYNSGLILFEVGVEESPKTWKDVKVVKSDFSRNYLAPPTYNEVAEDFRVEPLFDQTVNNTIAGFTPSQADTYCAFKGHLPSPSNIREMRTHHVWDQLVGDLDSWPKGKLLIVKLDGNYQLFNIDTGSFEPYKTGHHYVTCIHDDRFEIITPVRRVMANGMRQEVLRVKNPRPASISVEVELEQNNVEVINGTLTLSHTLLDENGQITTDKKNAVESIYYLAGVAKGYFSFKVYDIAKPTRPLYSAPISFIGDYRTMDIREAIKYTPQYQDAGIVIANDQDIVHANMSLTDANGIPVPDRMVAIYPTFDEDTGGEISSHYFKRLFTWADLVSNEEGTIHTAFKALPYGLVSEEHPVRNLSIAIANEQTGPFIRVKVIHPYLATDIEVTDIDTSPVRRKNYKKFRVKVIDKVTGEPVAAPIRVVSIEGDASLVALGSEYTGVLTERNFSVPIEGLDFMLVQTSRTAGDVIGNINFDILGSTDLDPTNRVVLPGSWYQYHELNSNWLPPELPNAETFLKRYLLDGSETDWLQYIMRVTDERTAELPTKATLTADQIERMLGRIFEMDNQGPYTGFLIWGEDPASREILYAGDKMRFVFNGDIWQRIY